MPRRTKPAEKDRGCLNKRRFDTKEACQASIDRQKCLFKLYPYKCKFGPHWHKTKNPPRKECRHGGKQD